MQSLPRVFATLDARSLPSDGLTVIDTRFDFRTDTPEGCDPDLRSPTLRRYHRILWSKPLPSGVEFKLVERSPPGYLLHRSSLGEYRLSSDTVVPLFRHERRFASLFATVSDEEMHTFDRLRYSIGGMMVFPSNQVDRKQTINAKRGLHHQIKDRFDFTVECIRRHYAGESSPLSETLDRYRSFFALFGSFRGYVEFFLLQDLVSEDHTAVRFFSPFEDFGKSPPLPEDDEAYGRYCVLARDFLVARNARIADFCSA